MVVAPEVVARQAIDADLVDAGWVVQDIASMNLYASQGIAVREFPLKSGHGFADYLLFVDGQAVGAVEGKKKGDISRVDCRPRPALTRAVLNPLPGRVAGMHHQPPLR